VIYYYKGFSHNIKRSYAADLLHSTSYIHRLVTFYLNFIYFSFTVLTYGIHLLQIHCISAYSMTYVNGRVC